MNILSDYDRMSGVMRLDRTGFEHKLHEEKYHRVDLRKILRVSGIPTMEDRNTVLLHSEIRIVRCCGSSTACIIVTASQAAAEEKLRSRNVDSRKKPNLHPGFTSHYAARSRPIPSRCVTRGS